MKKLFFTLIFCIFAIYTFAQEPLTFKGIPIKGNLNKFCKKLKSKGFTETKRYNTLVIFEGEFTGHKVNVYVGGDKTVLTVSVFFEQIDDWNSLITQYYYYKSIYTTKYGEPSFIQESKPTTGDTNADYMLELHDGNLKYWTAWMLSDGSTSIKIKKSDVEDDMSGKIVIDYTNNEPAQKLVERDLDEI